MSELEVYISGYMTSVCTVIELEAGKLCSSTFVRKRLLIPESFNYIIHVYYIKFEFFFSISTLYIIYICYSQSVKPVITCND